MQQELSQKIQDEIQHSQNLKQAFMQFQQSPEGESWKNECESITNTLDNSISQLENFQQHLATS